MRHTLVNGPTLLVSAPAVGADAPIPQDIARMEKRRSERLEWNRRTTVGAYDKVGKKNPRWDEPARKAMDLTARMFSEQVDPEVLNSDVNPPAQAAIDAGCDDPFLVYLYNRSLSGPKHPGPEEMIRRMKAVAKALAASRYPAVRRAFALELAGDYGLSVKTPDEQTRKEAERNYDAALALLAESVANDERNEFWEALWFDTLRQIITGYRRLGLAAPAAYERVDAALSKLPQVKALRFLLRGNFWISYGWEARTTAPAVAVPAGGFDTLEKRLVLAKEALDEAWRLRPGDALAAINLMTINKATTGDRAAMEFWFERAMKSDGDRYGVCLEKLDWLDPKWHGTGEEMVAFGRACRATKNWRVGITLLVADAHYRFASRLEQKEKMKYLSTPAVWSEIVAVFDEFLKHHPSRDVVRSNYALIAFAAGKFPEAHAQFQTLGDRLTASSMSPHIELEEMKRLRGLAEKLATGKARLADPDQAPAGWARVNGRNNEGTWSVSLPAKPERRQEAGILGAKARNVMTSTAKGATYTVRIQVVPPAAKAGGVEAVLDAARDAIAKEHGGQVRDEHPATLAELPAQEYLIEAPAPRPSIVRVRAGKSSAVGSTSSPSSPTRRTSRARPPPSSSIRSTSSNRKMPGRRTFGTIITLQRNRT